MKKIVMMGTPDFAVPILKTLVEHAVAWDAQVVGVVTQPDRPKGRKLTLTPPPLKVTAEELGLPIFQPEKIKAEDAIATLRAWEPDLIVTAAFGQLLPPEILEMPGSGCINVHASLLPKYRGAAPIHRAIMNGDAETGVTIMHMARGMDTGDMIISQSTPIGSKDTVGTMHDRLAEIGASLLVEVIPQLFAGTAPRTPQAHDQATHAAKTTRADEWLDWNRKAIELDCQVRGLNPWPVAYTEFDGEVLKVWEAQAVTNNPFVEQIAKSVDPGTVIALDYQGISVATGESAIWLKSVQPAGKKAMPAQEFAKGARLRLGQRFGGSK